MTSALVVVLLLAIGILLSLLAAEPPSEATTESPAHDAGEQLGRHRATIQIGA